MITINTCKVCGNNEFQTHVELKDYFFTQEDFVIQKCISCGFKFTNPHPETEHLSKYYKTEDYVSHSDAKNTFFLKIYQLVRKFTLKNKYKIINRRIKNTAAPVILDYGCATAEFLNVCKQKGYQCYGIEPDEETRNYASEKHQIAVHSPEYLANFKTDFFDVITLWHVLEHIPDLNEKLQAFHALIKPDGVVVVAVPNCDCYDAKYYEKYWAGYDVPRHLHHFNHHTLTRLLKNHNFEIIKRRPMRFDSYYAGILSEKYKKKRLAFMKGCFRGLLSNLKAMKSRNYSSMIYILRKSSVAS